MSEQKPLTEEEKKLLNQFNSLKTTEDRVKWVDDNKQLFQADEGYRDKGVLHSGWNDANRKEAEAFAKREGGITLEQLSGGRILEKADLYNQNDGKGANEVWGKACEHYAGSLQGNVHSFAHNADKERLLAKHELPVLMEQNKNVTHINGKDIQAVREVWNSTENKTLAASRVMEATDRTKLIEYKPEQKQEPQQTGRRDVSEEPIRQGQQRAPEQSQRRDVSEEKLTANQQREPQQKQRRDVSDERINAETQKQAPQQQQATRRDVSEERIGQQQPRQNTRRDVSEEKINQQRETQQQTAQEQEQTRQRR